MSNAGWDEIIRELKAVLRTNCVDCLDRTNFGGESAHLPKGVGGLRRPVVEPSLVVGRELGRTVKDICQHRRPRTSFAQSRKRGLADVNLNSFLPCSPFT
ncbi:hypothetical protein EI94DRAFT_1803905 [Lactarius quietus]|nr:hypothetical protein EI94DRAFT_1803905 [Lactarius quietus]